MQNNDQNYFLSKKDFFKLLKIFCDQRPFEKMQCKKYLYPDTIGLFSGLEELIQLLAREGVNVLSTFEKQSQHNEVIESVLLALQQLSVFPDSRLLSEHSSLCSVFLKHFLCFIRDSANVDPSIKFDKVMRNTAYIERRQRAIALLKNYAVYLGDNKIRGRTHKPEFLDRLIKIEETWKNDIQALTSRVGLLYAFGMKIRINHQFETYDDQFRRLFLNRYKHLDCFQNIPTVVYTIAKPMVGIDHALEYFVIVLINEDGKDNFEEFMIQAVLENTLKAYLEPSYPDITLQIRNFNSDLITTFPERYQGKRWLSHFSRKENLNVWNGFLGFMLELEKFQCMSDNFLRMIGDWDYLSRNNSPCHIYSKNNFKAELPYKSYLLKLVQIERSKLIWKTEHLTANSQDYFANLSRVNKEYLRQTRRNGFLELSNRIEIFMLSIKESSVSAFGNYDRQIRGRYHQSLEDSVTRSLLQFVQLLLKHEQILEFKRLCTPLLCSRLLNHFLYIYDQKKIILEKVLGLDIQKTENRREVNKLIHDFIYPKDIFLKRVAQVEGERGKATDIKQLIRIPLHQARLIKVKNYLNQAMKSDVVIIRCQFGCETKGIHLKQQAMSSLFYQMMHAGKRRKPLSAITAYLGFWEWSKKNHGINQLTANVFFIFNSSILNDFPDLYTEMKSAWENTLIKYAQVYEDKIKFSYQTQFAKNDLIHSMEEFATDQVVVENINKKLKKMFIDHVSSFVVYRDLLDDDFYATTPKWLIRGTEPRKVKAKKLRKSPASNKPDKSQDISIINFHEIASDNFS